MASFFSKVAAGVKSTLDGGGGRDSGSAWVDDVETDTCCNCKLLIKPGLISSGKHHCRLCGLVVCGDCSKNKKVVVPGQSPVRLCDKCFEVSNRADAVEALYKPLLLTGELFQKHPGSEGSLGGLKLGSLKIGGVSPRYVCLTPRLDEIMWAAPTSRTTVKGTIPVATITAVLKGQQSAAFARTGISPELEQRCFSIVSKSRTLDLEAVSMSQRDSWVQAVGEYTKFFKMEKPQDLSISGRMDIVCRNMEKEQDEMRQARQKRNDALREKYHLKS